MSTRELVSELDSSSKVDYFNQIEDQQGFFSDILIDYKKLQKEDLQLLEKHNFLEKTGLFSKILKRKNIIKYGIISGEFAVNEIEAKGNVKIALIEKEQLLKRMKNERNKIQFIHINTIQILLKSTFMEGINCPVKLEIRDDRFINPQNATIAKGTCNLKCGKVRFDISLKICLSIRENLDKTITFWYEFLDKNLMNKGTYPMGISYRINYCLTNSMHSIQFKESDYIHIDQVFSPLVELHRPLQMNRVSTDRRIIKLNQDEEEPEIIKIDSKRLEVPELIKINQKLDNITKRL